MVALGFRNECMKLFWENGFGDIWCRGLEGGL